MLFIELFEASIRAQMEEDLDSKQLQFRFPDSLLKTRAVFKKE